ncbi:MAG: hypothetical protein KF778_21610 [Rhodocyclaceae bacterium]|uniref:Uncharacterized protein n=1 Tax=metagenome TaxID=256318 RepID=A0A380TH58_9ZZZZ|nr:hypothetical protein [Rhodocyclaceae bacterium]SUS07755.1 hypothetical protein DF3PB_50025 [uncultured Defluviicoccus sp.]
MLVVSLRHDRAQPRLYLRGVPVTAWIEPRAGMLGDIDWTLWIERHGRPSCARSPARLAVESRLRAWLLRRYHRPLATLSFARLRQIADAEAAKAEAPNRRWRKPGQRPGMS